MIVDIDQRQTTPQGSGMVYSTFQTDIFDAVQNTEDNLIVEAVAGSGKTTTIVHALELIPSGKSAIFVAFNKSIAEELAKKVPPFVEARTLHSVGFEVLRKNFKHVKSNGNKSRNLLQYEILKTAEHPEYREWYFANGQEAGKLISRMKSAMITNFSNPNLEEIIEDIDLDLPTDPWSLSVYRQLAERSYEFTGEKGACVIDFDDMLYQPLAHKCDFPQYDFVFVDEAQDLNHVQRLFISCLLKHDGRMVAVGDTHQAIYGFRGASHNSMDLIKEHYGCRELPLSICYRCDTSIVEVAQQFVPHIEARRGAGPGVVEIVENAGHFRLYKSGDYILCRTNAPLVHEAMRLSIMGNNVCILGNDVVPRLAKMAKEIEKDEGCICNRTIKQYGMNNAWRIPQEKKFKRAVFDDNLEVLGYIAGDTEMSADSIKKVLDNIFFDKPPVEACIMLSTVHKAKGLEAERVFIIRPDLMPFPYAETAEELQQERNLIYVAVTRAKKELYYVRPDND